MNSYATLRALLHLSRQSMAEEVGVTVKDIKSWEDESSRPKIEQIKKLAILSSRLDMDDFLFFLKSINL